MSKNVELDVAQATLSELVAGLTPDDDIVIMKDRKPVARLVATAVVRPPRIPGLMKGKLTVLAEDDEHLEGFAGDTP
jgi:antitoxin (DNA-binding transcriptional repressor) of toxin-antitoxin stability system